MSSESIVLKVRGKAYSGWTGATVDKSMTNMVGAFGFTATNIFPGELKKFGIAMQDECTVEIEGQKLITGYVDSMPISYDSTSHNIRIGGRDKTADLVDCSFDQDANEWNDQTILEVITALCTPYDITVAVDSSVTSQANKKAADNTFKANEGDTISEMIIKLCKQQGILPVSYGDGKLTLTGTGTTKAHDVLETGKNIKRGSLDQDDKDRFSKYIVKGQGKGSGEKDFISIAQASGEYLDEIVKRYRPTVIFSEGLSDKGKCGDRAKWEALTKAGQSRKIEYELQGWTQSNGDVWPLNSLVKVKDSIIDIHTTLLIVATNFMLTNEEGTITRLTLMHPNAFKLATEPDPIKTESDWLS